MLDLKDTEKKTLLIVISQKYSFGSYMNHPPMNCYLRSPYESSNFKHLNFKVQILLKYGKINNWN